MQPALRNQTIARDRGEGWPRPFRKSGVRLNSEKLHDGRTIIHNYGHGGAGFTLSWACAEEVYTLAS